MYIQMHEVQEYIDLMISEYGINNRRTQDFYRRIINSFFESYMGQENNKNRPLKAITFFDVNTFLINLDCSDSYKSYQYYALKRYFNFTYLKGYTEEIMGKVEKPSVGKKSEKNAPLDDNSYEKLKQYILDENKPLRERLILGLFLFTGLSRKYIARLLLDDIEYEKGMYRLRVWKEDKERIEEVKLPLKAELQLMIYKYVSQRVEQGAVKSDKVFVLGEDYFSTLVKELGKEILGDSNLTITSLTKTFIRKVISYDGDIINVSKLILESVSTVAKGLNNDIDNDNKMSILVNSF